MKNLLLATTCITCVAAPAFADIKLTGRAEMGLGGGHKTNGQVYETQFHQDFWVQFNFSGETENGLKFGASAQIDDKNGADDPNGDPQLDDERAWISGDFGYLILGETDGAFDFALQEVGKASTLADETTTHRGYNGNNGTDDTYDNQILRYNKTVNDFTFAVSAELDDTGAADPALGLGLKWKGDVGDHKLALGFGYSSVDGAGARKMGGFELMNPTFIGVSAQLDLNNGWTLGANYSEGDGDNGTVDHYGVGITYKTGDWLFHGNYGEFGGSDDNKGFALAANYKLGGGAQPLPSPIVTAILVPRLKKMMGS